MDWVEVFVAFVVCHLVGDYLFQTDWQAVHKRGGLGSSPERRQALLTHVATYTLAFVPVLVALWDQLGAAVFGVAALIYIPHMIQDDGRLLTKYVARVKGPNAAELQHVFTAVDQSFHMVALFLLALLAAS
ncbi:MAG TPA: DUF3307 domain-containing protein [Thermoleophilaceae bacterium]|nr:DUF3307 domain-containing protein [Thermoleophilaceae bacterium]